MARCCPAPKQPAAGASRQLRMTQKQQGNTRDLQETLAATRGQHTAPAPRLGSCSVLPKQMGTGSAGGVNSRKAAGHTSLGWMGHWDMQLMQPENSPEMVQAARGEPQGQHDRQQGIWRRTEPQEKGNPPLVSAARLAPCSPPRYSPEGDSSLPSCRRSCHTSLPDPAGSNAVRWVTAVPAWG